MFGTSAEASRLIAEEIAQLIRDRGAREQRNVVLGLATGSSPLGVYRELVRMHREEKLSFANVVTFNLDEYYPMHPDALQSYVRFMKENFFDEVDILPENVHIPDGSLRGREDVSEFCDDYERLIDEAGGVDLQLLGIGRTGHVGFNEPGSPLDSKTRLVTLDHVTRIDAASDFFGVDNVPRKAITMGIGTIMKKCRRCIVMAWGENKASIVRQAIEGQICDHVPATHLQDHPNASYVLEASAGAELSRIREPWVLMPVEWNEANTKKAVIWLATKLGKAALKLTDRDYMDNGMADLILDHDSAYNINIRVFKMLQRTITGWPGGKPSSIAGADDGVHRPERAEPARKRVLIFSPHPDDDVISMGGTFQRLVDQGHDVSAAYQTSGNIAVFDDDVMRYADFVADVVDSDDGDSAVAAAARGAGNSLYGRVVRSIRSKKPGDVDTDEVLRIKALIRKSEARAACRYVGVPDEKIHFLNLPFYETGTVKKRLPGEDDYKIVMDLIRQIRPHQIYAAGDLSDPHGTHRVCLQVLLESVRRLKEDGTLNPVECWLWLYRGAWQEYPLDEIDMAVPLSPDEVLRKRRAIFKHQSQKDTALFPGADPREFWQRTEARNALLASNYDALGLPEYAAIEAFKRYCY